MLLYELVEKILFLENKIGYTVKYSNLDPRNIKSRNTLDLVGIAKYIMKFIGLKNIAVVVTWENIDENIGGQIELDNSNVVFIEISRKLVNNIDALLCVICHEIVHKYLVLNHIIL